MTRFKSQCCYLIGRQVLLLKSIILFIVPRTPNDMEHFERKTDSFSDFMRFQMKIRSKFLKRFSCSLTFIDCAKTIHRLIFSLFFDAASRVGAVAMTHYNIRHTLGQNCLTNSEAMENFLPRNDCMYRSIRRSRLKLNSIEFRWKTVGELTPFESNACQKVVCWCPVRANIYSFIYIFLYILSSSTGIIDASYQMRERDGTAAFRSLHHQAELRLKFLSLIAND